MLCVCVCVVCVRAHACPSLIITSHKHPPVVFDTCSVHPGGRGWLLSASTTESRGVAGGVIIRGPRYWSAYCPPCDPCNPCRLTPDPDPAVSPPPGTADDIRVGGSLERDCGGATDGMDAKLAKPAAVAGGVPPPKPARKEAAGAGSDVFVGWYASCASGLALDKASIRKRALASRWRSRLLSSSSPRTLPVSSGLDTPLALTPSSNPWWNCLCACCACKALRCSSESTLLSKSVDCSLEVSSSALAASSRDLRASLSVSSSTIRSFRRWMFDHAFLPHSYCSATLACRVVE